MPRSLKPLLLWIIPLVFLALFYFYPLASILDTSLARVENGLLATVSEALSSTATQRVIGFTIWQATLSTLLTLLVGLPGAYLLARYQFRGKSLLLALTSVAFVMPTLVVAAGFNALLGPNGWANLGLMSLLKLEQPPIQVIYTLWAILLAHVFYNLSIVLRLVGDFWARLDPRLQQAARSLGANRWQTFWHITLPLLAPAVLAAALLIFIFDFTSFGVILVLGGPRFATLEVEIYYQTISLFNLPLAAILSLIQLICTLTLTLIYTRLNARLARPLRQTSPIASQKRLNTWRARIASSLLIGGLLILTTAPLLSLAARSVTSPNTGRAREGIVTQGFTLEFYRALTRAEQQSAFYAPPAAAVAISLGYAAATVVLALLIGLPAAWALSHNQKSKISRALDPVLMLPLGTSAVTLGLGFIVALGAPPLDLRASPLLIPLAHTLVAFPFVVRSLTPALRSIQPRLRQAASVLGASPSQVVRQIDFPLVGRALIVAAAFAFTLSMGEFGATALVARPEYPTIPMVIYRYLTRPGGLNYGQAMALSTILMLTTLVGMLAIERLRIGEVNEF